MRLSWIDIFSLYADFTNFSTQADSFCRKHGFGETWFEFDIIENDAVH